MTNQQWRTLSAWQDLVGAAERYILEAGPTVRDGQIQPLSRRHLIRVAMFLHGIGAADVARDLGVSRSCVHGVIAGKYRTRRVEEHLSETFGLPVEFLFGPPGIRGRPRKSEIKPTRRRRGVNAEERASSGQGEDEVERARRLVG